MTAEGGQSAPVGRRTFLRRASLGGIALVVGTTRHARAVSLADGAPLNADYEPNQWIRIDDTGSVTIVAPYSEMGQGVRTSVPMIVAEELGADWARVTVVHAKPGKAYREMRTSGSSSVSDAWGTLRIAAAGAREVLIAAAAGAWGVDPGTCTTEANSVLHRASGRRLDFGALVARAASLPVPESPTLKAAADYKLLGTRVRRVDGPLLVDGRATFGLDVRVPGMRYAAVARPPQHGSKVRRWDEGAARAIPGVQQVVQISTGVAVVADRTWSALRGRDALTVTFDERDGAADSSLQYDRALERALPNGKTARREGGDVDLALQRAARRMEATYHLPFQGHAAMEPLNCVADVSDGSCRLWVGTQAPNEAQTEAAKLLGIPADRVDVTVTLLGGGFGRRLDIDYVLEAVELSRAIGAPVQVVWSRADDLRHDRYQSAQVNRLTAGLDATGLPVAWRHRVADYNLTMFGEFNPNNDPAADGDPWGGHDTPYAFPALDVTLAVLKSPVPTGAWRSVTYPAAVFARESFLDEIAHATGRDPLALRLALLPSPGPQRAGGRMLPNGDRLRAVLQLAAEKSGWSRPLPATGNGRRWGRGIACNAYHRGTMVAQVAEVSVGDQGDVQVHRVVCAVDCGQVVNLSGLEGQFESGVAWALSAALKGEVTFEGGRTRQSNFHDFPILRFNEAPAVEVHAIQSEFKPFGVGEQPVPAVAPAVLNAVYAATGKRIRRLPLHAADLRA